MRVVLTDKAKSHLAALTKVIQLRIVKKLLYVEEAGVVVLERMTDEPFFKLRIGDYRAIGSVESDTFIVFLIRHRSKVYKELN